MSESPLDNVPTSPPPDTPIEEEEDGEDLMENLDDDYKEMKELDTFESQDLDETSYQPMHPSQRRAAERLLNERDRRLGRGRRTFIPHTMLADEEDDIPERLLNIQRRPNLLSGIDSIDNINNMDNDNMNDNLVNLEDFDGPLREWLDEERVRREIRHRFKQFLTSFTDNSGEAIYPEKLKRMCQDNRCSLEVSYLDLSKSIAVLAIWVVEKPAVMLELFDAVAMEVVKISFPEYHKIHSVIHVRITQLPITDELRDLRQLHLNAFVQVSGVVIRRTSIFPQLQLVRFDCLKCGYCTSPIAMKTALNTSNLSNKQTFKPNSCPDCQSNGPFKINESQTVYRNYQKIVLQESPGSVPAGRIPRSRDVILIDDLCDSIRPGEQICVTGIYKNQFDVDMNVQHGFPVFSTIIEANNIMKEKDFYSNFQITDDEKEQIVKLSKEMNIENKILSSIAPSIYGHDYIKRAIAYSLFGGQEKNHNNKHRVRGDINILILGDPGTAKSQFLKWTEKISFRSVYATGKGASAVGLTASVRRDAITKEWTLEGGALVLADRGICLIDEFDKMNDNDRTSIHEAMEQQTISISKAGIVATLQARCAVIAAANPIKGRYDGSLTFIENVDLTDPILSRFDVLTVIRDKVDPIKDELLASFVVENHIISHPRNINKNIMDNNMNNNNNNNNGTQISQELLRKYILYAKTNCFPKLDNIDRDKIAKFYSELRQKSMQGGGIPIAVRHIESILRMAEARARLHLREYVRNDDIDMAMSVLLESFIDTQKQSIQVSLKKYFKNYLTFSKDSIELLLHLLNNEISEEINWRNILSVNENNEELQEQSIEIDLRRFEEKCESMAVSSMALNDFYHSDIFKNEGFVIDRKKKTHC